MGKEHPVNLSQESRGHHAIASRSLQAAAQFAELGDRFGNLPEEIPLPAAAVVMKFGESADRVPAESRHGFANDCARYAVVGMITACDLYLVQLCFVADLAAKALPTGGRMKTEEFWEMAEARRQKLRRMSLRSVVLAMDRLLGTQVAKLPAMLWFESLKDLRNCLVHRGGEVGVPDLNRDGELHVLWRKPVLEVNGTRIDTLPFHVDRGQEIAISFTEQVRSWRLGESVALTASECQEIALSLALFCNAILEEFQSGLQRTAGASAEVTP